MEDFFNEEEEQNTGEFVNKLFLHLHTCYSLLDGLSKPEKVAKKIKELGYTHVSISDHGTVGGCLEFYQACKKEGITPVIGCEVYVKLRDNPNNIKERSHLVLLCKNLIGWKNLLRLTRESYNHFYRKPMVTLELLEKYKEGLIATSACFAGVVAQFINTEIDFAVQNLGKMKEIFGEDFYIELQPNSLQEQVQLNVQLYHLAKQRGVKTVIGIDSHYTNKEDAQAQETLLGINTKAKITDPIKKEMYAEMVETEIDESGDTDVAPDEEEVEDAIENEEAKGLPADLPPVKQRKPKYRFSFGSYDFWIMSTDEIVEFWNKHHNRVGNSNQPEFHLEILAQSFRNHSEIISKLEEFTVEPDRNGLSMDFQINATPKFLAFHERQADKSDIKFNYLRYLCNLGIRKLGIDKKPNKDAYIARIKHELSEIKEANIVDYFLIVWDVVRWMRTNGLETGIGRGCVISGTQVLTSDGFKNIENITVGTKVVTSSGKLELVTNTMSYPVLEEEALVSLRVQHSFQPIVLTDNHKVLAHKCEYTEEYKKAKEKDKGKRRRYKEANINNISYIEAKNLEFGDSIYTPWPKDREINDIESIDLSQYAEHNATIKEDIIEVRIPLKNRLSKRQISKEIGVSRNGINNINNPNMIHNSKSRALKIKMEGHLCKMGYSLKEWLEMDNTKLTNIKKIVSFDEDFCFFLGLWIGDGWVRTKIQNTGGVTGLAFNSEKDQEIISWVHGYLSKLGFEICYRKTKNKNLLQMVIYSEILASAICNLFPSYERTCVSKDIGRFCKLPDNKLKKILLGLLASDGFISQKDQRECIDTTSEKMALEIKEALLYLKIPSDIIIRQPFMRGEYKCNTSYKIRFKGLKNEERSGIQIQDKNGYLSKIIKIEKKNSIDRVFDISVLNNPSYVTSQGCLHNSAAGSLSAYVLGIHGIDSLEYDLLWERFYNAGRAQTLPDVDLDTPPARVAEVIKYLTEKYGEENVASICNYAYFSPKTTIKSVLSYYNFEYKSVNDVVKNARPNDTSDEHDPEEKDYDISLDQDMKEMEDLLHNKHIKELVETSPHKDLIHRDCLAIVGGIKNSSQHASGVVITKAPLLDLCPVTGRPGDMPKTGWDGGQLDAMGFMKLDVLKVKLLDIIADTKANIYKNKADGYDGVNKSIDWKAFDKTDVKTIEVFAKGNTTGCFQFDAGTEMQHLCKKFGLKSFADVCALSALGRPGAKNFIPDYIQNRNRDESQIELLDKRLLPILKPTNFVLVYQEQQMRMCVDLAGFTLKEADNLRKVVAKKKVDKIPEMKEKFVNGYVVSVMGEPPECDGNLGEEACFVWGNETEQVAKTAEKIWDKYFSECAYLFNKSHAVAYSVNSFATAYLKAHFPYEFMSAVLNHNNFSERKGKRTKVKRDLFIPFIWEVMRMDLGFIPPHYLYSEIDFSEKTVKGKRQIVSGLFGVKKISDSTCRKIKEDPRKALCETLTKAQYEPLILAGVFDGWEGLNRRQILETVKSYRSLKEQWKKYDEKQGKYEEAVIKYNEHLASGKKSKRKAPEVPIAPPQQKGTVNPVLVQDFGLDEKIRFEEEYLGYAPSSPDFKWMGYVIECTTYSYRQRESWQDGQEILIYGKISELTEKESTRDASEKYARVKIKAKDSFFTATAWNREYDKFKERLSDNMNSHLFKCRVKFVPDKKDTSKMIKMLNIISVKGIEEK